MVPANLRENVKLPPRSFSSGENQTYKVLFYLKKIKKNGVGFLSVNSRCIKA